MSTIPHPSAEPWTAETRPPAVGALLRMAWTTVRDAQLAALPGAGFGDVRPAHLPFMRYPPIDGKRPGELAADLHLSKQFVNDLLRELEDLGYLRLEVDATDRRARLIRLTDRGWALMNMSARLSREIGERWADAVGAERYAQFEETLREIVVLEGRPRAEVRPGGAGPAGPPPSTT